MLDVQACFAILAIIRVKVTRADQLIEKSYDASDIISSAHPYRDQPFLSLSSPKLRRKGSRTTYALEPFSKTNRLQPPLHLKTGY